VLLVGDDTNDQNLHQKGAPFYNALHWVGILRNHWRNNNSPETGTSVWDFVFDDRQLLHQLPETIERLWLVATVEVAPLPLEIVFQQVEVFLLDVESETVGAAADTAALLAGELLWLGIHDYFLTPVTSAAFLSDGSTR
jgi:hypothetical protein